MPTGAQIGGQETAARSFSQKSSGSLLMRALFNSLADGHRGPVRWYGITFRRFCFKCLGLPLSVNGKKQLHGPLTCHTNLLPRTCLDRVRDIDSCLDLPFGNSGGTSGLPGQGLTVAGSFFGLPYLISPKSLLPGFRRTAKLSYQRWSIDLQDCICYKRMHNKLFSS